LRPIGKIKSNRMIRTNLSEARDNLSDLVNRVGYGQERIMLERHGKPVAVIVSLEDINRLEAFEDASGSALLKLKQEKDELMLSLFLDLLMEKALQNSEELESYTEEMVSEDDELMAGVVLDS
jgi:prevent-host-death family protein